MVKKICKDVFFLGQKAEPATEADRQVGQDLLDTLKANKAHCVGMDEKSHFKIDNNLSHFLEYISRKWLIFLIRSI